MRLSLHLSLVLFASICGAAEVAASKAERFPSYDGSLLPIDRPFLPEYHSFDSVETMLVTIDDPDKPGKRIRITTTSERSATRNGNRLTVTSRIVDVDAPGGRLDRKTRKALGSLVTTAVGDVWGNVEAFDIAGYEHAYTVFGETAPKRGSAEHTALLEQAKAGGSQALPVLPKQAVTVGSTLSSTSFWKMSGEAPDPVLVEMMGDPPVESRVRGWGIFDGRKVLVTDMLVEVPINVPGEFSGSFYLVGYTLHDANSLAVVKSEVAGLMSGQSPDGESGSFRMDFALNAKVSNREDQAPVTIVRSVATPRLAGLVIQSKDDTSGERKTYAFFDVQWTIAPPAGREIAGKLVLLDKAGRERVVMPWTISSEDAAKASFTESQVGFELTSFGEAQQWLRLSDVPDIDVRFDPSP